MFYPSDRINLHTHSCFCDHAQGSIDDYVSSAIDSGLEVLGFTEHAPVPGDPISCNMMMHNLKNYVSAVRNADKKNKIHVLLGAECDYDPMLKNFYKEELLEKNGFDYLIASVHLYFSRELRAFEFVSRSKDFTKYLTDYVAVYCSALESGLFAFGCHPDLFRASYLPWDSNAIAASKDIIQCAVQLGIPLEINAGGLRQKKISTPSGERQPYTTGEFFQLGSELGLKTLISTDAHLAKDVAAVEACRLLADKCHLNPLGCTIDTDGKLKL